MPATAPQNPRAAPTALAPYPRAHVVDVALRDGSSLHIRPVSPDDAPAVRDFLGTLSRESIGFRFFGSPNLDWVTEWSVDVDYSNRYALVATAGPGRAIVAHGAYMRLDDRRAEVAFMVSDSWQGKGIATIMLAHLAAAAEEHGISTFFAEVLPHNHRMIDVFVESGFPVSRHRREDVIEVEFPTSITEQALEHLDERDRTAAAAALRGFLAPHSVALVGASRHRRTIGGELLHNIASGGFTGELYPVNDKAATVQGRRAYRSLSAIGAPVDLAVIAVPAEKVVGVARECAQAGVHSLLVISGGFAESGPRGAERQQQLLGICRDAGMRLIGPNCLGLLNTSERVRLNATFAPGSPRPGGIGFLSQSGGLGIALIQGAGQLGLGLSSFVSVGDKADISGNDLLQYWEQDEGTDVVLLYLESFGNPRRFSRIARRVGASKPIVAVKSGRSAAGARAGVSHTGALVSSSDVTVDALFRQAGVIRTDTVHELFDAAAMLSGQPLPRGGRVAIVTNAGGPGILCADACQAAGLDVAELPARVQRRLSRFLDKQASLCNPVDMIASAPAESYRRTIELLAREDVCDAVVAIFVPPLVTDAEDAAREIRLAAEQAPGLALAAVFMTGEPVPAELTSGDAPPHAATPRPTKRGTAASAPAAAPALAAVFMTGEQMPAELAGAAERRVPGFQYPEDAARALGHAVRYARWRERPAGTVPRPQGCRPAAAAAVIARALASGGGGWLAAGQVTALLDCYGLPLVPTATVANAHEAVTAAERIGGPVALKAVASGLLHKSDAGGVELGLRGAREVTAAARRIEQAVGAAGHELQALLVQPMAQTEVELLMGVVTDQSFGPVIACGAGGTRAELLGDVAVRITPLTDLDIAEMLRSLRSFPLLAGYRGSPPCDVGALEDVLARLSALVEAHPEVVELDANPVAAGPDGALILDARVRVAPPPPRRPQPSLRS